MKRTLKNGGTVEVLRRGDRYVFVINDEVELGSEMFLYHLVDVLAESGGNVDELLNALGIPDDGVCAMCDRGLPRTRCPMCTVAARCGHCALAHDDSPLCRQTLEYANLHRQMRGGDTLDSTDRYFAVKSLLNAYERRSVQ